MPWLDYQEGNRDGRGLVDKHLGSQPGRGIFPRPGFAAVVVFDTKNRLKNGYENRWEKDVFLYYGMGPVGPMDMRKPENTAMPKK